ncbi:MAG: hypothetical protein KME13_11420 [Myxacorys californica WJT36-NPBG1]|jgi:hypothetical protein|nr:hypothetical protein [Myxacorys californica WJT36-NPBG1]
MRLSTDKLQPARFQVERKTFDAFHESLQTKHRWNRRLTQLVGVLGVVVLARAIVWFAWVPLPTPPNTSPTVDRPPIANPNGTRQLDFSADPNNPPKGCAGCSGSGTRLLGGQQ